MAIIKLQTNVPVTGTLKYADEAAGNFGPQLKLKGTWDQHGDGQIYLSNLDQALGQLRAIGAIQGEPKEGRDGLASYAVPRGGVRIQILQEEKGRAKPQTITLADGTSPAPTGQHRRQEAPPAAGTGRPANGKPQPPQGGSVAQPPREDDRVRFGRMRVLMAHCIDAACETWEARSPNVPWEVMAATAHTLYIDGQKQGIRCAPLTEHKPQQQQPPAQQPIQQPPQRQAAVQVKQEQLAEIERLRKACGGSEDDLLGQLEVWFNGPMQAGQLTERQAEWVIREMRRQAGDRLPHAG